MDEKKLREILSDLPLGGLAFYSQVGSTNDSALEWAKKGARDFCLVATDDQFRGRGRDGCSWVLPQGSGLAFSLILQPSTKESACPSLVNGLGALAVACALEELDLSPKIKWPNDVLLGGKKTCGVLLDVSWLDTSVDRMVLGIGVNIAPESVPPRDELSFPATCLENEMGRECDRWMVLKMILQQLLRWRPHLRNEDFITAWEIRLAYRNEKVKIGSRTGSVQTGKLVGLDSSGHLRLMDEGTLVTVGMGDVHLRPVL